MLFDMTNLYIDITGFTPSTKTAWAVENLGKHCSYSRDRETDRDRDSERDRKADRQRATDTEVEKQNLKETDR